jgi:hypothetical protein
MQACMFDVSLFGSSPEVKLKRFIYIPQNRLEMGEFFQETIDNHRATFDPSNIRDLIDTYLAEIQREKEEGRGESLFEGRDHGENHLYLNTCCKNWINNGTCKLSVFLCLEEDYFVPMHVP